MEDMDYFALKLQSGFSSPDRAIDFSTLSIESFVDQFESLEDKAKAFGRLDRLMGNLAHQLARQAEEQGNSLDMYRDSSVDLLTAITMEARNAANERK